MAVIRSSDSTELAISSPLWISIFCVFAFCSALITVIIGCACCSGDQKEKKNEEEHKEPDDKDGSKGKKKKTQEAKFKETVEKSKSKSGHEKKAEKSDPKASPKAEVPDQEAPKIEAKAEEPPPAAAAPAADAAPDFGFNIPAWSIVKDTEFNDTVMDLQQRQSFKPTMIVQHTHHKTTSKKKNAKSVMKTEVAKSTISFDHHAKTAVEISSRKTEREGGRCAVKKSLCDQQHVVASVGTQKATGDKTSPAASVVGGHHPTHGKEKQKGTKTKYYQTPETPSEEKGKKTNYVDKAAKTDHLETANPVDEMPKKESRKTQYTDAAAGTQPVRSKDKEKGGTKTRYTNDVHHEKKQGESMEKRSKSVMERAKKGPAHSMFFA